MLKTRIPIHKLKMGEDKMDFRDWLSKIELKDNAQGDLARDVKDDKCSPKDDTLQAWIEHLEFHFACDDAIKTLKLVWKSMKKGIIPPE